MHASKLATLAAALAAASAQAAIQYFTAAGGPQPWDNGGTPNWGDVSGGPYTNVWTGYNEAVFEGVGDNVNVAGGASANHLTFGVGGYRITNGTVTLGSPSGGPAITVSNGVSAAIASPLARAGGGTYLTKRGFGALTLAGAGSGQLGLAAYQGTLEVAGGSVTCANDVWVGSTGGAALSATDTNAAGTLLISGGSLTVSAPNFFMGQVINGTNTVSQFIQTGGTFWSSNTFFGLANGGGVSRMDLSGGTFTLAGVGMNFGVRASATLNITGTAYAAMSSLVYGHGSTAGGNSIVNLGGGVLQVGSIARGSGTATLNFNGGTLRARGNTGAFLQGLNTAAIQAGGAVIDTTNFTVTIGQALVGSGALTKTGPGTLILTASNTYAGLTSLSAGALVLNGALGTGGVTVASIGLLAGTGTVAGTVISAGRVAPGNGGPGLLYAGSYTQAPSGTLEIELGGTIPGAGHDQLRVAGHAALDGTLNVALTNGLIPNDLSFVILTAPSVTGTFAVTNLPALAGSYAWTVLYSPTSVVLSAASTNPAELVWSPTLSADWDLAATNWYDTGLAAPATYEQGDAVSFTEAGAASNFVWLTTALTPIRVTVNSSSNYTFAGPGRLQGTAALTKDGTGTLAIATTNLALGATTISNGTLQIGDGVSFAALGAGPVANGATLAFAHAATGVFANVVSGTGRLVHAGAGTTILAASNTYAGGTVIAAGTLQVGNGGLLGAIGTGGIQDDALLLFNLGGGTVVPNAIAGTGAVAKAGTGTIMLTASNTYAGGTSVAQGTLVVGDGAISGNLGAGAVTVGGALFFNRADVVLAPALTGAGTVGQIGPGEWHVDAVLDHQGGTSVSNGVARLGAAAVVTNTAQLHLAGPAGASFVLDGGTFTATNAGPNATGPLYVAGPAGSTASLVISSGVFTTSNADGLPTIGDYGSATVVQYGGVFNMAGGCYLANNGGSSTISLEGGRFINSSLLIGVRGVGVLNVSGTATAAITFVSFAHPSTTGTGILNLNGGVLLTAQIFKPNAGATATFNFNGGVLRAAAASTNFMQGLNSANVLAPGAIIDTAGHDITIGQPLMDNGGGLTKVGAGTLTLTGPCTYSGPTVVSGGTLRVMGTLGAPSAAQVVPGGTLAGRGLVGGTAQVEGTVEAEPGGTLTFGSDLAFLPGAAARFVLGGTATADVPRVRVTGIATLDGTLRVATTNGYVPAPGDTFTLLTSDASVVVNAFTNFALPALAANLGWLVDYPGLAAVTLSVTGSLAGATPYDLWAQAITNPAERAELSDPDGDGFANLLEYSQGSDPTNALDHAKLEATRINGQFVLFFNRVNAATDVLYEVEGTATPTNDAPWLGIATNWQGGWGSATNVNDNDTAAVHRVWVSDPAPATNRSLRLKVTRP